MLFALPFIALGAYGFVALGATIAIVRWAKTAENSTDYSVMNTARQMIWLPTTREENYKAKQAIDTFFVRAGDMLAAGLVFLGTHVLERGVAGFARVGDLTAAFVVFAGTSWLALEARGFAVVNVVVVLVWLALAFVVLRENRRLTAAKADE